MPLEKGGRADKIGNRYEIKCVIYELLNLINESNYSVVLEALGEDEQGTDILVTKFDGVKEHQQCKVRNASKEYWEITDLKTRNIIKNWKYHLCRDVNRKVTLVSPVGCSYLVDLHDRAMNTNGNPRDFYDVQIRKSSKEFCAFYHDFCTKLDLDYSNDNDILMSIDYLKRIEIKQISEYVIKESILQRIEFYFCTEPNVVYNALIAFVIDGDILGKEITTSILLDYLSEQNIKLRLLDGDKRIVPQINAVNYEYSICFKPLQEGLIPRDEFKQCIDAIKEEQNLIISGNAGYGKSGCTEAIIDYCRNEKIPYIAIKLDRKIPHKNCEQWGQELGFPGSVSYALHAVAKNETAVIILDQLDALRWTQANSSESLSVCMELIKQVRYINYDRAKKIIIVFVCRTYDLNNDNNIKMLFKAESNNRQKSDVWKRVVVDNFDEKVVETIVGDKYYNLNSKTKQLLKKPSNLYIWQHLDEAESYDDCTTTCHLIEKWNQQIRKRSIDVGVQETIVRETQERIVSILDHIGRLYAPKSILKVDEIGLDYLISAEMIVVDYNRIGFVHQSILDYFISERMMQEYFENKSIESIIGEKNKQTPNKRYQIQMFLQNLLEFDSAMFIEAGKKMLQSDDVRYYVKSVFYEILGQIVYPDENIKEFILDGCNDDTRRDLLLNNVICGNHAYISILRKDGVLERWFLDQKKQKLVFLLLRSISPNFDSEDVAFIKEKSFNNQEDDRQFFDCLMHDITEENDELFELRMMYYQQYPELAQELYVDVKSMMKKCEKRMIKLISFWLENKLKSNGSSIYRYEEELVGEDDSFSIINGRYILDELLQYIPKDNSWEVLYSDWSGRYINKRNIERATVGLIKKANKAIISQNPSLFWSYYEPYMGKNYAVYNEIILHGLKFLPQSYSNQVIDYLTNNINENIFDFTSGAEQQLGLVKEVIKVHTDLCDATYLSLLEESIRNYMSPKAKEWYRSRIEENRTKKYAPVYWSFWGDMQYQLLQCVSSEKLSSESKNLLEVLERKFKGESYRYKNGNSHSGGVTSPIAGKKIGKEQWLQIITNKKLKNRNHCSWKEVKGGFIESSLEMYASDFNSAVKEQPETMIQMVLENKENVASVYIDSMYSGSEFSECVKEVDKQTWEDMFRVFPCDMESQRASYFCGIVEKTNIYTWSPEVLAQLKQIALYYKGKKEKRLTEELSECNCEEIYSQALNCVRGDAARAIGHLLWDCKELFSEFQTVIQKFISDNDPVIKMASLYILWPSYNINREWAEIQILQLYESDIRMVGFPDSKGMFFRLYFKYRKRVLSVINKAFNSRDKKLIQTGGYSICEFYIRYNEFTQVISKITELNEEQIKAILHMAENYLEINEYREKAKDIILMYKNSDSDFEFPLSRIFYNKLVDVERDSDFLIRIMKSKVSKSVLHSFVRFLEESTSSIKAYADIVITLCRSVLEMDSESLAKQWGLQDYISKLVIELYDECGNSERESDKKIAIQCLELWDLMFEKQIGRVRDLSRKLMER